MTSYRARYFMARFLHEEKLLGPNEQAALHYVIALLEAPGAAPAAPPQREPYDQTALGLCNACGWKAVGPDGCLNCAPQREPLTDEQIEDLAHREAWTYRHSSDPHHSHTYKFNRACLLEFARKLLAASAPKDAG